MRAMRADAQRNRDKLVEVARQVFREKGYDAPLDEIAKRAGVGAGTLYRHFPTRDALHDAVMQAWADNVMVAAEKALAHEAPTARSCSTGSRRTSVWSAPTRAPRRRSPPLWATRSHRS